MVPRHSKPPPRAGTFWDRERAHLPTSMEMPGASQETYTYTQRTETVLSGGGVTGAENSHEGRAQGPWGSNEFDWANVPTGSTPSEYSHLE